MKKSSKSLKVDFVLLERIVKKIVRKFSQNVEKLNVWKNGIKNFSMYKI